MKRNNKQGFTLVELVIVVAVLAILAAIAIPTVSSITGSAKDSVNEANARTIESVIKLQETKGALSVDSVASAIADAKLGLEGKAGNVLYFFYDTDTGRCTSESAPKAANSANGFNIAFDGSSGSADAGGQAGITVTQISKTG